MSTTRSGSARRQSAPKASPKQPEALAQQGSAAEPTPDSASAPWGQAMGDVMQLWLDQLAQGQRTGLALVDSQVRMWQDMQANTTKMWMGGQAAELHVTPDSAGPALCPPLDFTPAGLARSTLGTWQALTAAWSTAVQHELQDLDETSRGRH
jgi:hypothetical protein